MGSQLHIFLFPFLADGHIVPIVDMAKLFASRGIKITILTTPLSSISISKSLHNFNSQIQLLLLDLPSSEAGLPGACENADSILTPALFFKFISAMDLLRPQLEHALMEHRPHCLVADMFFPWANEVASKFGTPTLIFHGFSFFALSASELISIHQPHDHVSSDTHPFLIPHLPGDIKLTKMQLPTFPHGNTLSDVSNFFAKIKQSESDCYGMVVNSFYELEAEYADCYRNVLGRKAWHIGPLSLCNKETQEKAQRGRESAIDEQECMKWLDSKKPNSVVYVCFGSMVKFNSDQLMEIAIGLEASGQEFIWVVRKGKEEEEEEGQNWSSEGFEQRTEGKGMIIRGWAPQVLILDHPAVGGFVTHCGWNSTLEGVTAGAPMVTWPVAAEQFYNEKLVSEVLKIGVPIGVEKWVMISGDFVRREAVEKGIRRVMEGEEAEEMRNRAKELANMARMAVAENGSSYSDLDALINELKSLTV
ncbi:UDP-glucose flavonoid 3-O-glucosyltransferase 7-like [Momordica charantia]|uniref:Glycosyltransferase n=1 Tax=Momordica charantia TaxID=3673 RepID=A0A6J1DN55_MOMCH|nr:UDP-glucose flavonoid 3-O-glucosyltransferase 7-like [Momordica charantia]